jgi:hypothetical protein
MGCSRIFRACKTRFGFKNGLTMIISWSADARSFAKTVFVTKFVKKAENQY